MKNIFFYKDKNFHQIFIDFLKTRQKPNTEIISLVAKVIEDVRINKDAALKLVGFIPTNKKQQLVAGSHFIEKGQIANLENDQGWMSSVAFSPMLNHSIGLGYIKRGNQRYGEKVNAVNPLKNEITEVEIHSPHFYDPEGELLRG